MRKSKFSRIWKNHVRKAWVRAAGDHDITMRLHNVAEGKDRCAIITALYGIRMPRSMRLSHILVRKNTIVFVDELSHLPRFDPTDLSLPR